MKEKTAFVCVCIINMINFIPGGCFPAEWSVRSLSVIECLIKRKLQT